MHYLLVFLGLIGLAIIVALGPLVIRFLEYCFPVAESDDPPARAANPQSIERLEVHDEIRRLTAALETDRPGSGRMNRLQ